MRRARQVIVGEVFVALVLSACDTAVVDSTGDTTAVDATGDTAAVDTAAVDATGDTTPVDSSGEPASDESVDPGPEPVDRPQACDNSAGVSWSAGESVDLELIGEDGGLSVYAAEYPLPGPTEGLWSQWGQGIAIGDGRYLSAVGDHLGADGNSWVFLYNDEDRSLTNIFDVLSVVPHEQGAWGYGKIHAQMVMDECGSVWATT